MSNRKTKKTGDLPYSETGIMMKNAYTDNAMSGKIGNGISNESNTKIVVNTSSEDHIYVNVAIVNNDPANVILAQTNSNRTTAIVDNPSDYYMSVVRFTIPLQQVPLFTFIDNLYTVTISNAGTDYQTTLLYVPFYTSNIIPTPTSPENRLVYSYQQFLDSINDALRTSFTASGLPGASPYMTYDPVTQLISLIAPATFHDTAFTDQNQPIKVWFNTPLWSFFSNFQKLFNGYTPTAVNTNGKNFNIIIKPTGDNEITIPASFGGPLAGLKMTQEFFSLFNWNDFRSLVITTNSIPIRAEIIPSGLIANNGKSGVNAGYRPVLTDFELLFEKAGDTRGFAQYTPTAEYRLIDLIGTTPLTNIDLQFWYQNKNLELFPLYISPLQSLDVKILLRKKYRPGVTGYHN